VSGWGPGRQASPDGAAVVPVDIHPRSDWAGGLAPTGPLEQEAPGDVRFLLVHHSVNANTYAAADVPGLLRGIYGAHTAPEKGWPDVAYNFFVDQHGGVWEGRDGSRDAPVKADATGGSQGFALLCCFLGDHRTEPPSPAAEDAMVGLLAHLASRYGIDVLPGATATFTSRGSNKHPEGATVTTPTIAGHRDMSATECPGDAGYALVTGRLRRDVETRMRAAAPATTTAPSSTAPPATAPAPTTAAPTSAAPRTSTSAPVTGGPAGTTTGAPVPGDDAASDLSAWPALGAGGLVVAAAAGALLGLRRRRST